MIQDQIVQNPKYMLIGEAPGEEEEKLNQPFVGPAGRQLDRLLLASGIDRKECYITNVIQERPTNNDFNLYYQDKQRKQPNSNLAQAWSSLQKKLSVIQPKICISFGNEALKAITGYSGIENRRGSYYCFQEIPIIATFHPSAILRGGGTSWWYFPVAIMDLQRARNLLENPQFPANPKIKVVDNVTELDHILRVADEYEMITAFDIETTMEGGERILCFGFSYHKDVGFVVPFMNVGATNLLDLQSTLRQYLQSPRIHWVGQNGYAFDLPMLKKHFAIDVKNYFFDTMVAHHVLQPEWPHSLAFLTSIYTLIPYYKDLIKTDLLRYNGLDVCATLEVALREIDELKRRKLYDLYRTYHHPLLQTFTTMQERGIKIDEEYQKDYKIKIKTKIKELQTKLDELVRSSTNINSLQLRLRRLQALAQGNRKTLRLTEKKTGKRIRRRISSLLSRCTKSIQKANTINVRSIKDMKKYLFETLGLPKQSKGGKVTVSESAINKLYIKTQNSALQKIIELRQLKNAYSRYGKLKTDEHSRVHTHYKFVETGRLSSGKYEVK